METHPASDVFQSLAGFVAFAVAAVVVLVRYPKVAHALGLVIGWLWRQGREALQRSQAPGEELSAPRSLDLRLGKAVSEPEPQSPIPQGAAGAIVEDVGRRSGPRHGGIVSDVSGWSPFR